MTSYHSISTAETLKDLKCTKSGLDENEVQKRLKEYGPNTLPKAKPLSKLEILLNQLKSPLVYILLIAAGLSFAVGESFDAIIILFAVLINTALGYVQENKASHALEELRALVHPEAHVRRSGEVQVIPADQIVPGDILILESGDKVVADARLLFITDLQSNESLLTGESLPVRKSIKSIASGALISERTNMVYMGSTIVAGRGEAVVVSTGIKTHLGETAELVQEIDEQATPLQTQLAKLSRFLAISVVIIGAIVIIIGVLQGKDVVEMITLAAALAVAAIPEGLLVGVTVILAIGMQKILKHKALVRHLVAAETLGSVSIICTDKTGTITEGKMQVSELVTSRGSINVYKFKGDQTKDTALALLIGMLNNNALAVGEGDELKELKLQGTPTEQALLSAGIHVGLSKKELDKEYVRLDEIPFSSSNKYMVTLHKWLGKKNAILVKGAPEVILKFSTKVFEDGKSKELTKKQLDEIYEQSLEMTSRGLRVLAVAYKEVSEKISTVEKSSLEKLVFVGFFGLADPLRPEAKGTIATAKSAGVRTIIITGDHPRTAQAIAVGVGFKLTAKNVVTGAEIEAMSDEEFESRLEKIDVFARVMPSHKVRIVQAWKKRGETVAMIGDGVNDAPALKAADIGVALGSGTEVAKQTSDMVLLDNNLSTLVDAIEQGRIIFDNIRKVVVYLLANSFSEVVLILGALIFGLPLPILAAQILWINLVADGFPDVALTLEPGEKGIMKEPPRRRNEPVINKEMKIIIFVIGGLTAVGLFVIFFYLLRRGLPIEEIRTFIFLALGINSLMYVFSVRSFRTSIFHTNPLGNKWLVGAVFVGAVFLALPLVIPGLRTLFGFVSLSLIEWIALIGIGTVQVLLIEIVKLWFNKHRIKALK